MFAEEFVIFTCTAYTVQVMIITSSLMGWKQQKKKYNNNNNMEITLMHFYANKMKKMHHQNFNISQDTRC